MNPQVEIVPSDAATEQTSLEQHGFTRRQFIAGSAATLAIAAAGGVSALEFPANAEALTEAEPLAANGFVPPAHRTARAPAESTHGSKMVRCAC